MIGRIKTACAACEVCFGSESCNSELLEHDATNRRILFVLNNSDRKNFKEIRDKLSESFSEFAVTFATKCNGLYDELSLNTCGVYTKLLLKYFPIVWMGTDGASQLSLEFKRFERERIEGCVIFFGENCVDSFEVSSLKNIDFDYTNLKNLIGG